jgi:transcriptional regulator with XRE-family HTH domain
MTNRDRPRVQPLGGLDVGTLVRDARAFAGLSQRELADRLGTTQSSVSAWEHGKDMPRVDTLGRILSACGFEADLSFRRHDDVDRAQIRQQLRMTNEDRVASSENISELVGLARAR